MNIKEIEKKLKEKLGDEKLEKLVKTKLAEGAITRSSAINKIYREVKAEKIGESEVEGLYLGATLRTRFRDYSVWLATKEGLQRTVSVEKPEAEPLYYVKANLDIYENLEGTRWTQLRKLSSERREGLAINDYLSSLQTGMVLQRGTIGMATEISVFEGGEPVETLPVLGTDGVNLRLITSIQGKDVIIKLQNQSPDVLVELLGDISWIERRPREEAIKEISDILRNSELLIFGRYADEIEGKAVRPFVDIRNGWIKKL